MGFAPLRSDTPISLQSDVPLPAKKGRKQRLFPWVEMNIGDSFFVAGRTQQRVGGNAHTAGKRYGLKYVTRAVTENGVKGVRVWRVA